MENKQGFLPAIQAKLKQTKQKVSLMHTSIMAEIA